MLQNPFEGILSLISSALFSVWIIIITGTIVYWVFNWGKNEFQLRMNGKPKPFNVTHNSFEVRWNRPTFAFPSSYILYVRNVTADEVRECKTSGRECSMRVTNLSPNTKFVLSVCACIDTYTGPIGDESDVITTKKLAFKMKSSSTLLQITQATPNSLPIYAVKYEVEEIDVKKIRRIMIGEAPDDGPNQNGKGLLIFSTPHSGKTTLLQGMMNFIFGVSSTDNFRFCFAPELYNMSDLYQDWVTVYDFQEHEGGNLGFPLTIIDIPRIYGSKRKYMETLHEQMNFLVNSFRTKIDCICFVAQANTFSFPYDQIKHVQLIKYLFETDSDADMSCFFTFADLGPAHVKKILEVNNIAFNESFSVNCSNLFQTNEKSSDFFWKTNYNAFDKFFNHLQVSVTKSLRKKLHGPGDPLIPENRKELTSNIAVLYPEVRKDLAKLGEIKYHLKKFSNHKEEIMSTGDFSFTIEEITQTKKPLEPEQHVTNCMHCFCTCHKDCSYENNDDKYMCCAMTDGHCTFCIDRCKWFLHENTPHIYIYDSVKVTKSYKEMKSTYEAEKGKPLDYNQYLEQLNKDVEALLRRLHDKVTRMNSYDYELRGIPKSPLAGSFDAIIDKMIEAEKKGEEIGFQYRVEMFQELKKYADLIRISHPADSSNVIYYR